jgi:hypothetical protein
MAKNERSVTIAPAFAPKARETQVDEEQKVLVAGPGAGAAILARPQVARLTADAKEFQPSLSHDPSGAVPGTNTENYFQPGERGTAAGARGDTSPSRIVGDDVTGMPRAGEAFRDTVVDLGADLASGGRPDTDPHTAGLQGQALKDYHRSVTDWPAQVGAGDEPMQKGGQLGK